MAFAALRGLLDAEFFEEAGGDNGNLLGVLDEFDNFHVTVGLVGAGAASSACVVAVRAIATASVAQSGQDNLLGENLCDGDFLVDFGASFVGAEAAMGYMPTSRWLVGELAGAQPASQAISGALGLVVGSVEAEIPTCGV